MLWETIIENFSRNPRDVKTIPTRGSGLWFYVSSKDGKVYISRALGRTPSSQVQGTRPLDKNKCETMFALYQRRKAGESVSEEGRSVTHNQVYWYGIFHEMGL